MITHFTVQSSVTTECVPLFAAEVWIMMKMIIKIMKNNKLNENNKLIMYDLTAVNCTYNYTHRGKVSKYVICITTMYAASISAKSYAFCVTLPMVSQGLLWMSITRCSTECVAYPLPGK